MKLGYKRTEVGVIPEDWEVREIDSLCGTITTGKLDANAMRPDGPYRFYTCAKDYYQIDQFAFDCEALLISGNGAHVGYIHYYQGKFNAYQRTYVLFGFREDIKFIQHYLSENFKKRIEVEVKAGGTPYITRPTIAETALPIPPLPEQRAIAEALSDVDGLLGGLDRLIAKKRDLKQAAMQQLLTGQTRLLGFHGDWEETNLGEVATFLKGKGLPKSAISEHGAEPCIHYGELFTQYSETIRETLNRTNETRNCARSVANDVLMPTSDVTPRGLAKASCVLLDGIILGGDILIIRSDRNRVFGTFLSFVIRREENQVLQLVTGTTVYHLYGSEMRKFRFKLPPLPEQIAIAQILSDMDAELTALKQRREKTLALKQAMMQELLTGRTRLV